MTVLLQRLRGRGSSKIWNAPLILRLGAVAIVWSIELRVFVGFVASGFFRILWFLGFV